MAVAVTLNTPLAEALNNVVQPKLAEVGWSTGGQDDSALAEYVVLMLVNGKTREQVSAELSNDLLALEPGDTQVEEFSSWLFDQVVVLNNHLNGQPDPQASLDDQSSAQAIPSFSDQPARSSSRGSRQDGESAEQDATMGDGEGTGQDRSVPTGPKAMRGPRQGGRGPIMGQISKAMERPNDSVLHRVRSQSGNERINSHSREPPKGPRNPVRNARIPNGRPMGAMGMPGVGVPNGGPGANMLPLPQQAQMQLMAMMEEQARMMAQFMPGLVQPAINPAFQNGPPQNQGRSLFERVEGQPQRRNGTFNRRTQENASTGRAKSEDAAMDTEFHIKTNDELSSSMEVESSQKASPDLGPNAICHFNLKCTRKDCPYAHQSPAAPEGTTIDVTDHCPFGAACKNRKCVARHPSPAQKTTHQADELCKFFPHCTNPTCSFKHPTMPMCRNGADCTVPHCKFTHQQTPCRFNPCLNRTCLFKHAEGQKGQYKDMVWKAGNDENKEKEHLSERKFIDDEDAEEELIKPDVTGNIDEVKTEAELVT